MNVNELRAERHDLYLKADGLVQSAKRAGKDLGGDDATLFAGCISRMKTIDERLDAAEGVSGRMERDRSFPALPTTTNPRVPVGQPAQSVRDRGVRGSRSLPKAKALPST